MLLFGCFEIKNSKDNKEYPGQESSRFLRIFTYTDDRLILVMLE